MSRHLAEFLTYVPIVYDAGTATVAITPSATDVAVHTYVDAATPQVTITPSGQIPFDYSDAATAQVKFTPSAFDIREHVVTDVGTIYLNITASFTEYRMPYDSDLVIQDALQRWQITATGPEEQQPGPTGTNRFTFTAETRWYIGESTKHTL